MWNGRRGRHKRILQSSWQSERTALSLCPKHTRRNRNTAENRFYSIDDSHTHLFLFSSPSVNVLFPSFHFNRVDRWVATKMNETYWHWASWPGVQRDEYKSNQYTSCMDTKNVNTLRRCMCACENRIDRYTTTVNKMKRYGSIHRIDLLRWSAEWSVCIVSESLAHGVEAIVAAAAAT